MDNILSVESIDNQQPRPLEKYYGYVYITTNIVNGKQYLGVKESSVFVSAYKGSGKILWKAINKYGWDSFKTEVYSWHKTKEELYNEEKKLSIEWNVVKSSHWYNVMEGGKGGNTKLNYTEEQMNNFRNKISISKSNRPLTEKELANVEKMHKAWRGKHHTEETKEKIRKSNLGHPVSEEMRQHMRENHTDFSGEKNPFYGKKHSLETRKKLSEHNAYALKGKIWITNKVDKEYLIFPNEFDNFPNFVRGRLRKSQKSKIKN